MNNGFVGYDKERIPRLISDIQNNYDSLFTKLSKDIETRYIDAMKTAWVCPDAVSFFKADFSTSINALISDINNSMISVSGAINSACEAYAQAGGDTWVRRELQLKSFQGYTIDGVIKDYDATLGGQGGSLAQYETAKGILETIRSECANCTQNITNASLQSGFVGGEQEAKLHEALQTIDNKISESFTAIINAVNTRVNDAIQKYGAIGAATTSAYTVS